MQRKPLPAGPLAAAAERIVGDLNPVAVMVYGSRAIDRGRPGSDHDLAVLMAGPQPGWEQLSRLRLDLEEILGTNVDLAVLDSASPVLAMQVLKNGQLVWCRDSEALERFTVATLTDYADLKTVRAPIEKRLMELRGK